MSLLGGGDLERCRFLERSSRCLGGERERDLERESERWCLLPSSFSALRLSFFSRFSSLRCSFRFRFSSFFASWSVLGSAELGTAIAFAPVAEPPVTLEPPVLAPGANPLQPTCQTYTTGSKHKYTYNAADRASASCSFILLISSLIASSSPSFLSREYQWTSLFFCHLPVGALILCPR